MAMACCLSSFLTSPHIACEPSSLYLSPFHRTPCACSKFFGPVKRRIGHSSPVKYYFNTTLRTNFQFHSNNSSLVPLSTDDSGLICRVIWSIEADLINGSVVFLTGDPLSLGRWDPDLAVPFSPSLQNTNLYEAEIKVPYGINFKYNYFIKQSSSVIEWRGGPECFISIPVLTGDLQLIRVRDCWMRNVVNRLPFPSWGSWLFHHAYNNNNNADNNNNNADQIRHETSSLGESEILTSQNGSLHINGQDCIEMRDTDIDNTDSVTSKLLKRLIGQEKIKEKEKEKEVGSTVILVNSSVCTMQRIAVLEEGKLVEILLEPVKHRVKVDDIYLGEITRMTPELGSAFVNIGVKRQCMFDSISKERAPFVFSTEERENEEREVEEREEEIIEGVCEEERESFEESGEDVQEEEERETDAEVDVKEGKKSNHWVNVKEGTRIIVQVVKEGLGKKGPTITPYPILRSRFWILKTRGKTAGVSTKITGQERGRLRKFAKNLKPEGFTLIARTVAARHSFGELKKDLDELLFTWNDTIRRAKFKAAQGVVPALLRHAMGQTLFVVQDYFNHKVKKMVVDSQDTYKEIRGYLEKMAPELCERVELYEKKVPIFDEYKIEEEINGILSKRVSLPNGGSLVIEQTEAMVSIDVNIDKSLFEEGIFQEKDALDINLEAAKQIARELRLRNIGGLIIVNFINMTDYSNKMLLYFEMSTAVKQDSSNVNVCEFSDLCIMEISRKRVRPSVSHMISDPCTCCLASGQVEAVEMSFLKIENEIRRLVAKSNKNTDISKPNLKDPKIWPKFGLRVDEHMYIYLKSRNSSKLAVLSISLNAHISVKEDSSFPRGKFELFPLNDDKRARDQQGVVEATNNTKHHLLIQKLRSLTE